MPSAADSGLLEETVKFTLRWKRDRVQSDENSSALAASCRR